MKRLLLATVLFTAPMLAHAADAPKIDPANLATHIKILSSDAFEGRGPATAGETKTVILERYRQNPADPYWALCFGLRPAEELYDLAADLSEKNNLATSQPAETARLTAAVVAWHRSLPADNGVTYKPPAKNKKS